MYKKRYNSFLEVISLYLEDYSKEFFLREISKLTNLPLKTTQNTLKYLEENSVLLSRQHGKNKYFYLNLKEPIAKNYLIETEVYKLTNFLSKNPSFKPFFKTINTNVPIILFGSYAKEKATSDSDIDLLVLSKEKIETTILPKKVQVQILSEKEFLENSTKEPLLKEIRKNHIIFNNPSFYVNTYWSQNE